MNILITGSGGFVGGHLCKRLLEEGHTVIGADIKPITDWDQYNCTDHHIVDLRDQSAIVSLFGLYGVFDEVYTLAADMGGAGYIFTGEHDADVMHNSAQINLNIAKACVDYKAGRVFYSSSACMYNQDYQDDPANPGLKEYMGWPLNPDSEYGVEKGFSERLYKAFERNYGLTVRIARFHNIFGPQGTWKGGKEKAPAAICRKVAETLEGPPKHYKKLTWVKENGSTVQDIVNTNYTITYPPVYNTLINGEKTAETLVQGEHLDDLFIPGTIDIWGDGKQTRSFLYIDECIDGVIKLMRSDCTDIVNIGSDEMISINDLAKMVIDISGKNLTINNIDGPTGVRGRNSNNDLIFEKLNWKPTQPLRTGMEKLYNWVNEQVCSNK